MIIAAAETIAGHRMVTTLGQEVFVSSEIGETMSEIVACGTAAVSEPVTG